MDQTRTTVLLLIALALFPTQSKAARTGLYHFKGPEGFFYESARLAKRVAYIDSDSYFLLDYDPPRQQMVDLASDLNLFVSAKQVAPLSETTDLKLVWEIRSINVDGNSIRVRFRAPPAPLGLPSSIHPACIAFPDSDLKKLTLYFNPAVTRKGDWFQSTSKSQIKSFGDARSNSVTTRLTFQFITPLRAFQTHWVNASEIRIDCTFNPAKTPRILIHPLHGGFDRGDIDSATPSLLFSKTLMETLKPKAGLTRTTDTYLFPWAARIRAKDEMIDALIGIEVIPADSKTQISIHYENPVSLPLARYLAIAIGRGAGVEGVFRKQHAFTYGHEFPSLLLEIRGGLDREQAEKLAKVLNSGISHAWQ